MDLRPQLTRSAFIAKKLLETGQPIGHEGKCRRRDGSFVQVEVSASLIRYGDRSAFCITAKDITSRKAAGNEIRRLALLAQKTRNSVLVSDRNGYVERVNEGFTRLSGYTAEEIVINRRS